MNENNLIKNFIAYQASRYTIEGLSLRSSHLQKKKFTREREDINKYILEVHKRELSELNWPLCVKQYGGQY